MLKRNQILNLFTSTVFSDEVGFNKPHKVMFETALRELEIDPSEAVHVGNLLETDIAGAKKIGMKAVLLCKEPNGNEKADAIIGSLIELPSAIKRLS